jgi:hypothetical protein
MMDENETLPPELEVPELPVLPVGKRWRKGLHERSLFPRFTADGKLVRKVDTPLQAYEAAYERYGELAEQNRPRYISYAQTTSNDPARLDLQDNYVRFRSELSFAWNNAITAFAGVNRAFRNWDTPPGSKDVRDTSGGIRSMREALDNASS